MAEFRMREDAERWFKHIGDSPPLKTKFDRYYFCLLVGLANPRRSGPGEVSPAPGFVDTMPEDYRQAQELLVGLMLCAEIDRMGVELTEREDVRRILAGLVGANGLSSDGVARMNEYASGGFDVLQEAGIAEPYTVGDFLLQYYSLLNSLLD